MTEFTIGDRRFESDDPPFVLAEFDINYQGSIGRAVQMGAPAAGSGAACVSLQTHITEMEVISTDIRPGDISDEPLWDIIKRCELATQQERADSGHCPPRHRSPARHPAVRRNSTSPRAKSAPATAKASMSSSTSAAKAS